MWVIAANDLTVDNAAIRQDHLDNAATGAASVLIGKGEEPLLAARFTGVWDSSGDRVVSIGEAVPPGPNQCAAGLSRRHP